MIAPSHPGFGGSPLPPDFDTMYDLVQSVSGRSGCDRIGRRHRHRIFVRRLDRGGTGGGEPETSRPPGAGRSGRNQARRPRRPRHRAFLQYRSGRTQPAQLARSGTPTGGDLRARLAGDDQRRDDGCGDDHACPELGFAVPVCLAAAHVQSATETLAASDQRADEGDLGRGRSHRHAGLWPSLRRPHSRCGIHRHRRRRPSPGTGTTGRVRDRGHGIHEASADDVHHSHRRRTAVRRRIHHPVDTAHAGVGRPAARGIFSATAIPTTAKAQRLNVVPVHDGWYADDTGGGVAIWGQGRFWEIRDTPFTVRETSAERRRRIGQAADGEVVNVRQAIFGV